MRKSGWIALTAAIFLSCVGQAADDAKDWRVVDPDNLLLIGTKYGEVAVELSPKFAPRHVERMKALVRAHFFDGLNFYRVIDGFVAQGGAGEDTASTANKPKNPADEEAWPKLKREFERRWGKDAKFTPLGSPDLFARQTGHVDGFPSEGRIDDLAVGLCRHDDDGFIVDQPVGEELGHVRRERRLIVVEVDNVIVRFKQEVAGTAGHDHTLLPRPR